MCVCVCVYATCLQLEPFLAELARRLVGLGPSDAGALLTSHASGPRSLRGKASLAAAAPSPPTSGALASPANASPARPAAPAAGAAAAAAAGTAATAAAVKGEIESATAAAAAAAAEHTLLHAPLDTFVSAGPARPRRPAGRMMLGRAGSLPAALGRDSAETMQAASLQLIQQAADAASKQHAAQANGAVAAGPSALQLTLNTVSCEDMSVGGTQALLGSGTETGRDGRAFGAVPLPALPVAQHT